MSARTLHEQVWALLDAIPRLNAYDGEVPGKPPSDDDGRVYAYAVLYAGAGRPEALMLDDAQDSLDAGFQVTCAGGHVDRALWAIDQVRAALLDATVTVGGYPHRITARDLDPGTLRRDEDVKPPRHYLPLLFDVFIP